MKTLTEKLNNLAHQNNNSCVFLIEADNLAIVDLIGRILFNKNGIRFSGKIGRNNGVYKHYLTRMVSSKLMIDLMILKKYNIWKDDVSEFGITREEFVDMMSGVEIIFRSKTPQSKYPYLEEL